MAVDAIYLAEFKADLFALSGDEMFARYIATNTCRGIVGVDEAALRSAIATHFQLPVSNVLIVGSAKVGFTLRHKKAKANDEADRPPFSEFYDGSDVDVAIVSDRLFDDIWKRCFKFGHTSGYANSPTYWPTGQNFRDYLFRGWMRPDHLPSEGNFQYKNDWFDFFRRLTSARLAGDYSIKAGLYREPYFLVEYQKIALKQCRSGMSVTS